MEEKEKSLFDYKLGEEVEKDLFNGIMKSPNKLVKIGYTFQSKEGTQMEVALKTDGFIEDEETFICDECKSEVTKTYESIDNPNKQICKSCSDEECEEGGE